MPSSGSGKEDVLRQVNHFWSMLDHLCQDDPGAYRTFIEKQMKEGKGFSAAPEVHSSIRTHMLEPNQGPLYINLCSWERVPAPQHPGEPLPLYAGKLETEDKGGQGPCAVLDVAVNPVLLQGCKPSEKEMKQLYALLLKFAQKQHDLKLSQRYSPVSSSPRSTAEHLYRRLGFQRWPRVGMKADDGGEIACPTPASLLQNLSSRHTEEEEFFVAHKPTEHKEKNLIQVLSSTCVQPRRPEYQVEVRPGAAGAPRCVELRVELPNISNTSECQVRVCKDDVLLEVEDVYYLLLDFPHLVDEDSATAVFNKKKRQLTLRVNIL